MGTPYSQVVSGEIVKPGRSRTISVHIEAEVEATYVDYNFIHEYHDTQNQPHYFLGPYGTMATSRVHIGFIAQSFTPGVIRKQTPNGRVSYYGLYVGDEDLIFDVLPPAPSFEDAFETTVVNWSGNFTLDCTLKLEQFEYFDVKLSHWVFREYLAEDTTATVVMSGQGHSRTLTYTFAKGRFMPKDLQMSMGYLQMSASTSSHFVDDPRNAFSQQFPNNQIPENQTIWAREHAAMIENFHAANHSWGPATATASATWTGPGTSNAVDLSVSMPTGLGSMTSVTANASSSRTANSAQVSAWYKPIQTMVQKAAHYRVSQPETTTTPLIFLRGYGNSGNPNRGRRSTDADGRASDSYVFGGSRLDWTSIKRVQPNNNESTIDKTTISGNIKSPTFTHDVFGVLPADNPLCPAVYIDQGTDPEDQVKPSGFVGSYTTFRRPGTNIPGPAFSQAAEIFYQGGGAFPWIAYDSSNVAPGGWRGRATPGSGAQTVPTVTIADGKLRFRYSGEAGNDLPQFRTWEAQMVFPFARPSQQIGYRYTRFRIRCIEAANQTLRFAYDGLNSGSLTTGAAGEWLEVEYDLYSNTNFQPNGSLSQNLVQLAHAVGEMRFYQFPANLTFEVEWIKGVRKHESFIRVWGLPATMPVDNTANQRNIHQSLSGWTDGLQTLNLSLAERRGFGQDAPYLFPLSRIENTINTLIGAGSPATTIGNSWLGWSMSVAPARPTIDLMITFDDMYYQGTQSYFLAGCGLTYETAQSQVATDWTHVPANELLTNATRLPITPTALRPDFYDGCGDVLGYGDGQYGSTIMSHIDIVTGLRLHGVLIGGSRNIQATNNVTGEVTGATVGESGYYELNKQGVVVIPDGSGGHYNQYTLSGFGKALYFRQQPFNQVAATPPHVFGGSSTIANQMTIGGYFYCRIYAESSALWLSFDVSDTQRMARATTSADGKLVINASSLPELGWSTRTATFNAGRPSLRYQRGSASGGIVVVFEDGAAIVRRTTLNEGNTFSVATNVFASGKFPCVAIGPTGLEHHFCRSDSGAILGRILDSTGNQVKAQFTAVTSGVAEDAIAAEWQGGVLRLMYRDTSSVIKMATSADGGKTFV